MGDFVVFTEAIAIELIKQGFILKEQSALAWHFEDNALIAEAVAALI